MCKIRRHLIVKRAEIDLTVSHMARRFREKRKYFESVLKDKLHIFKHGTERKRKQSNPDEDGDRQPKRRKTANGEG